MPKVYYVKKARKENPVAKVGESYYWWRFAFGAKQYSKVRPKASQLTQSGYLSQVYAIQESIGVDTFTEFDNISNDIETIVSQLEELNYECQDSLDNMPEHLQDTSNAGLLLQERIDYIENSVNELQSIDIPEHPTDWSDEYSNWEDLTDEDHEHIKEEWYDSQLEEIISEVNNLIQDTAI